MLLFLVWLLGAAVAAVPLRLSQSLAGRLGGLFAVLILPTMIFVRRSGLNLHVAQAIIALYVAFWLYCLLHMSQPSGGHVYRLTAGLLSNISHPLYLVHLPVVVFLCAVTNRTWHQFPKSPGPLLMLLMLDLVPVSVAYNFHVLFERQTEKIRKALLSRAVRDRHLPARHSSAIVN